MLCFCKFISLKACRPDQFDASHFDLSPAFLLRVEDLNWDSYIDFILAAVSVSLIDDYFVYASVRVNYPVPG